MGLAAEWEVARRWRLWCYLRVSEAAGGEDGAEGEEEEGQLGQQEVEEVLTRQAEHRDNSHTWDVDEDRCQSREWYDMCDLPLPSDGAWVAMVVAERRRLWPECRPWLAARSPSSTHSTASRP